MSFFKKIKSDLGKKREPAEKPTEEKEMIEELEKELEQPKKTDWTKIVLFVVGIIVAIVVIIFIALPWISRSGAGWSISQGISGIFSTYSFRKLIYELTHPFEVTPEESEVEENPYKQQTMEGIRVELQVYQNEIPYGNPFAIGIKIKNLGSKDVKRVDIEFANPHNPAFGFTYQPTKCIDISEMKCSGATVEYQGEFGGNYTYVMHVDNIPAGSEKDIICTNLILDEKCRPPEGVSNAKLTHVLSVRGVTYYVSNARLPIEVIDSDYAQTLMKNGKFYTVAQVATAEIGAPLKINLNTLADQPLIDTIGQTSVMVGYEVPASGKLATKGGKNKFPILLITTEKSPIDMGKPTMFGEGCIMDGKVATEYPTKSCCFEGELYWGCEICDNDLSDACKYGLIRDLRKEIENYSDEAAQVLETYCQLANSNKKHVCFNTLLRQEFKGYVIPNIKVPDINTKRETFYITVTAIYPYASESSAQIYGIATR